MNKSATTAPAVTRPEAIALIAWVKAAALKARVQYIRANKLIHKNLREGAPRPFGKRRLLLSPEALQVHMQAVADRRECHRRLLVLVPVYRMLVRGRQHRGALEFEGDATKRIVNFLGAWEVSAKEGSPEMAALHDIVSPGRQFFAGTRPVTNVPAGTSKQDKADMRLALLDKVNARTHGLSNLEQVALREALNLWAAH
jgi:hypothetical protein